MAEIPEVTDDRFDAGGLGHPLSALVDFRGDHCPACRQISPILKDLGERLVSA